MKHHLVLNTKEEAIALLNHMVHHNEDHLEELNDLFAYLKDSLDAEVYSLFLTAIKDLETANKVLDDVQKRIK